MVMNLEAATVANFIHMMDCIRYRGCSVKEVPLFASQIVSAVERQIFDASNFFKYYFFTKGNMLVHFHMHQHACAHTMLYEL